jgi:hypothetical protein
MDVGRREAAVKPTGKYLRRSMDKTSPIRKPVSVLSPIQVILDRR